MSTHYEKYTKPRRRRNPDKRNEEKKRNYKQTQFGNLNKKQRYNQRHEQMILDRNFSDRELHQIIGRSVQAIQVHRVKLKKKLVETGGLSF